MPQALLQILLTKPELLEGHAQAYAALIALQSRRAAQAVGRSALCYAIAVGAGFTSVVLGGTAAMLWLLAANVSTLQISCLIAIPMLPLVLALGAWRAARQADAYAPLQQVWHQVQQDLAMLRETPEP